MDFLARGRDQILALLKKTLRDPANTQALGLWAAAIATGFIAVEYAQLFKFLEKVLIQLNGHPYAMHALPVIGIPAAFLVVRLWAPEAAGSGIPQIMAANELDYKVSAPAVDRLLSLKVAAVKVVSSMLAIVSGAAIGREGPTLQISACVFHFCGRRVRRFFPSMDSHTWIIAGAAAGLASAFNTPLGGIVYAIEEMGTVHFQRVKTPMFTSVIIAGLVSQWLLGPYLYLGYPALQQISVNFLPYSLLVGILSGAFGAYFGVLLARAVDWRSQFKDLRTQVALAAVCGVLISFMLWLNPLATGSGSEIFGRLLFNGENAEPSLVVLRFLATGISYLSGSAGGIFSPSLAAGATAGSFLDSLLATGHPNLMVLLGMIGFLTGVTRTPFTSFILVLEMTDRHAAIFPMMVCAVVANAAARVVYPHGFYEIMKVKYLATASPPAPPA